VYCWHFINCLHLWTTTLAHHATASRDSAEGGSGAGAVHRGRARGRRPAAPGVPSDSGHHGHCAAGPHGALLPLRLHCVRMLSELAAATGEDEVPTPYIVH